MTGKALTTSLRLSCVTLLALSLVACGGKRKVRASAHLQMGKASLSEGNSEGALADLLAAYELDKSDPEITHYLGMAYWYKGRVLQDANLLVKGEEYVIKSLSMDANPNWRNNLGALYIDMGRYEEARRECESALKDPNYRTPERALNNIGKAYLEEGKYEEALDPLNRALRVQPRSCQALWNKAAAHKGLKQWDPALRAVSKVNETCPSWVAPYLLKAEVLWYGKRDAKAALEAVERVQALAPDSPDAEKAIDLARLIER